MEYIKEMCEEKGLDEEVVISKIMEELDLKRNNKKVKHLPWNGKISEEGCQGLKYCNGLFIQCSKEIVENNYCKVCLKQSVTNSSGKPSAGTVSCRLKFKPLDYIDPNGRKVKPYSFYMKKNGLSRHIVLEAARQQNITINEEQLQEFVTKRGRPKGSTNSSKKSTNTSHAHEESKHSDDNDDDETLLDYQPMPTPPPTQTQEELGSEKPPPTQTQEELGSENPPPSHIKNHDKPDDEPDDDKPDDEPDDDEEKQDDEPDDDEPDEEEEELECEEIEHNGTTYYKSDANIVYNDESEAIGVWNVNESRIVFN